MTSSYVFFDIESTGLDPEHDRIVELAMVRHDSPEDRYGWTGLVNPGCRIPAESTRVHGITDADVKDKPLFKDIAADIHDLVEDTVLVGYNSRHFDTPMLHHELVRAIGQGLPTDDHGQLTIPEIDLFRVWKESEKRNLTTAVKRFLGRDISASAHRADVDTEVLPDLMTAMMETFSLDEAELEDITQPEDEVDRSGKFRRREDGVIVFAFGKNKDRPVSQHSDYLGWMLRSSFPSDTRAWIRRMLNIR